MMTDETVLVYIYSIIPYNWSLEFTRVYVKELNFASDFKGEEFCFDLVTSIFHRSKASQTS